MFYAKWWYPALKFSSAADEYWEFLPLRLLEDEFAHATITFVFYGLKFQN